MESRPRLGREILLTLLLLLLFGIAPLGAGRSSASVSPCPLRDPGPDSGWVRVPEDFWTVMEAVEAAVHRELYRVWVGPGSYAFSLPELGAPSLKRILLCGLGPGFTVLLHQGFPRDLPPDLAPGPWIYLSPKEGEEVVLEGFTLIGGAIRISADRFARVLLRNLHILAPGDLSLKGWDGITITLLREGAQAILEQVTVQGASTGIEILHSGEGEVLLQGALVSGNEFSGISISGQGRTIILGSQVIYNGGSGVTTDGEPWIAIQSSEIAYNKYDGINVGSGTRLLEVNDTRIFANGRYGIKLFLEPCWERVRNPFQGEVRGRGNEIFDNAKGDLCPADYPWPSGFVRSP